LAALLTAELRRGAWWGRKFVYSSETELNAARFIVIFKRWR
jgi:hypothetical protein